MKVTPVLHEDDERYLIETDPNEGDPRGPRGFIYDGTTGVSYPEGYCASLTKWSPYWEPYTGPAIDVPAPAKGNTAGG